MFHVTLFEFFRAARGCYDFARSLTVALGKAVGRFKNMAGNGVRGWDNMIDLYGGHNSGRDNVFKWRCVLSRVF